jgi:hypothetical protein
MKSTASPSRDQREFNWRRTGGVVRSLVLVAGLFAWQWPADHCAANPWVPIANPVTPDVGNTVPPPKLVPGKDFSDIRDRDAAGVFDLEQVVAWDGSGGVRDSFDYSGSRAFYPPDTGVDGIAAGGDALFQALRDDQSALLFSAEGDSRVLYVRPTSNPNATPGFGVWATATDLDATNPPIDVDGLEVWGGDNNDDTDRYSLAGDPFAQFPAAPQKVAIWNYNVGSGTSVAHTLTTDLAAAMDLQYGGIGVGGALWSQLVEQMDVDAIMTYGKQVTFSIRPLDLSLIDPRLPNLDGGEIFLYDDATSPTKFLIQGGYTWDTALDVKGTFGTTTENIDALEAVSVPEPGGLTLLVAGTLGLFWYSRRR